MKSRNWTQEQLASAGGVKQATISRYLSRGVTPSFQFIFNLYKNEKVDPLVFFRDFNDSELTLENLESQNEKQRLTENITEFLRKLRRRPKVFDLTNELFELGENDLTVIEVMVKRLKDKK
ncbi:helix-turn-helix domain-containing protein [Leptospira sp. WS92.C1]